MEVFQPEGSTEALVPPRLANLVRELAETNTRDVIDSPHDSETKSTRLRKKFKKVVDNVRALNRIQSGSGLWTGGVAQEPGLDYTTMDVEGFHGPCEVIVVDYSARKCTVSKRMTMLQEFQEFFDCDRPKWSRVRWINVDGLNWPTIKLLATKYNLHRLAIEDLLSVQRTKIDLYSDHTYICLLLHVLVTENDEIVMDEEGTALQNGWKDDRKPDKSLFRKIREFFSRSEQKDELVRDAETVAGMEEPQHLCVGPLGRNGPDDRKLLLDAKSKMRETKNLTVAVEQVSIFLTNDGTLITFFQQSGGAVERPIMQRLASENTILRESEDSSLLLQSIIDAVVDLSFPIATAYQELIVDLEVDVLTNPQMSHTRELHIVSGELNILKRTLSPLYSMINALRDRRPPSSGRAGGYFSSAAGAGGGGSGQTTPRGPPHLPKGVADWEEKTRGADISVAARMYLADVADHVLILTEEIDMLRGTVENMINMIFNMVASTQNESMRQLTMVSLLFLPLTFITGYFGMNFNTKHWSVLIDNGPEYFWSIALPTTILVICLLMFSYIHRLLKTFSRQIVRKTVKIKLQKSREMRRHRGAGGIPRYESGKMLNPLSEESER